MFVSLMHEEKVGGKPTYIMDAEDGTALYAISFAKKEGVIEGGDLVVATGVKGEKIEQVSQISFIKLPKPVK